MKRVTITTVCLLLFLFTTNGLAQGLYLGAGIGNTFFSSEVDDALDQAREIDENSTAWKLFAGFPLSDFLNIEGGYRSFGSIESSISSDVFETSTGGWDVEALGRIQIIKIIDIFAKAGVMFWSTETTFIGITSDRSGTDFLWGLGVGVHLGPIGARLEWESVTVEGPDNLSMVSLSATIGF